jgi:hypothetical protein
MFASRVCNIEVFDKHVLFEFLVITAVTMKSSVLWDIMKYSSVKVSRRFGASIIRLPPKIEVMCSPERQLTHRISWSYMQKKKKTELFKHLFPYKTSRSN